MKDLVEKIGCGIAVIFAVLAGVASVQMIGELGCGGTVFFWVVVGVIAWFFFCVIDW